MARPSQSVRNATSRFLLRHKRNQSAARINPRPTKRCRERACQATATWFPWMDSRSDSSASALVYGFHTPGPALGNSGNLLQASGIIPLGTISSGRGPTGTDLRCMTVGWAFRTESGLHDPDVERFEAKHRSCGLRLRASRSGFRHVGWNRIAFSTFIVQRFNS